MQASDDFSAGDFRYEGGGESTCRLMGWGWDMRAVFEIPGEVFSDIQ
jgi:hypothetical protein